MNSAVRAANGRFARGYNCAQSVFSAFAEDHGLSVETALCLAEPFGGGMGRAAEVCGALTGALMALGLEYGNEHPASKEDVYRVTREFMEQFQQQHGAIRCSELLGHDISTLEGLQAARDSNAFASTCPALVDQTAKALIRYISDLSPK